jgi:hypothetical protein
MWKSLNHFLSVKSGMRQGCSFSPLLFNRVLGILATVIRQEEKIKGIWTEKEEFKLSIFANDIFLCQKDPKNSTKKTHRHINTFSKVPWYKINIQKSVTFLYTNSERTEKDFRKKICFSPHKSKIPRNKFNKEVKNLYSGKFKSPNKEIEENIRR